MDIVNKLIIQLYLGIERLASYIGIIINQYKDPYYSSLKVDGKLSLHIGLFLDPLHPPTFWYLCRHLF